MKRGIPITTALLTAGQLLLIDPAMAQQAAADQAEPLKAEIARQRSQIETQARALQEQQRRLDALEAKLNASLAASTEPTQSANTNAPPTEHVGRAPIDVDRPPAVAVLGDQGSVITRAGQLTAEAQFEYARADRNQAVFRGIEVVQSVLVGVFDINQSRQDVLTADAAFRYGLTNRLEIGVKVPFVYRADNSVVAPVQGSTNNDPAATTNLATKAANIGDVEATIRYQLTDAVNGLPFLIANLQLDAPTGRDPFAVPRDALGHALKSATGSGFWGVSPSITAILPTDPAILFGTIGYTHNFGHGVNAVIPPVTIEHVWPGAELSFSAGIGVALNSQTTLNLGYAHSWAFGTKVRTSQVNTQGQTIVQDVTARDLQLGRLLLGVTYQVNNRTSVSWSVEVGATDDAPNVHTVLRIPFVLLAGH